MQVSYWLTDPGDGYSFIWAIKVCAASKRGKVWFSAVLVLNRISFFFILVLNRVWF